MNKVGGIRGAQANAIKTKVTCIPPNTGLLSADSGKISIDPGLDYWDFKTALIMFRSKFLVYENELGINIRALRVSLP